MRGKPLQIGDTIIYRVYNTPSRHFYGPFEKGIIIDIQKKNGIKRYYTNNFTHDYKMWLWRKEIKKVLDK
jgi:hypothetical protein